MSQHETELSRQIITSPYGQKIYRKLPPIYGHSYVALNIINAIGVQFDDIEEWSNDYVKQIVPQTTTWAISLWENEYDIVPLPDWTLEQRRQNVIDVMCSDAAMPPKRIEQILSNAIGKDLTVVEHTNPYKFTVCLHEKITESEKKILERLLEKLKQAHMYYEFEYRLKGTFKYGAVVDTYLAIDEAEKDDYITVTEGIEHIPGGSIPIMPLIDFIEPTTYVDVYLKPMTVIIGRKKYVINDTLILYGVEEGFEIYLTAYDDEDINLSTEDLTDEMAGFVSLLLGTALYNADTGEYSFIWDKNLKFKSSLTNTETGYGNIEQTTGGYYGDISPYPLWTWYRVSVYYNSWKAIGENVTWKQLAIGKERWD